MSKRCFCFPPLGVFAYYYYQGKGVQVGGRGQVGDAYFKENSMGT